MSKIKVIIPAYNEEKLLHTLLKKFQIQLVKLLLFPTQLIILLKWQQQLATVLRKQERVWLCLLKRNGVHFEPNKTRYRVLDGDYSDYPDELTTYCSILENNIDFVVGPGSIKRKKLDDHKILELASNNFNENLL
jgi:hypothetical protein